MNKTDLFNFFDRQISEKAIRKVDDEWRIVGKFCYVTVMEDGVTIDIWLCTPTDIAKGLSPRTLTHRVNALKVIVGDAVTELTGEAYTQTQHKDAVLQNLKLLGIRKARHVTDEQRQVTAERLREYRATADQGQVGDDAATPEGENFDLFAQLEDA
jgi:hypothetical protein